jgi:hypothetical protein
MNLIKKALYLSITILWFSSGITGNLYAQMKSGYRFGINLTTMSIKRNGQGIAAETPVGIQFGGMYEIPFSRKFTMQSGFILTSKGTDYKMDSQDHSLAPAYFEVPAQAVYYCGRRKFRVSFFTGPYFSTAFGGYKIESEGMKDLTFGRRNYKDLKMLDWGVNAGTALNIKSFVISFQYGVGLRNVSPQYGMNMKNRVIGISIGSLLPPRK